MIRYPRMEDVSSSWCRPWCALVMIFLGIGASAQPEPASSKQSLADFLLEYMEVRYPGLDVDGDVLYVSVRSQRLHHVRGRVLLRSYVISTALNGLGERLNSFRTPTGLHYIRERIGEGLPPWSILRERRPTGTVFDSTGTPDSDVITSRILRLSGMEAGVNEGGSVDSFARAIYLHGTADEASLGTPSSHGCIRMHNRDVIALFEEVPIGTLVVIYDN